MPRTRAVPKGYLSIKQVAERLNLSTVWVYELIRQKAIQTYKFGITVIKETDVSRLEVPEPNQ